MRVGATCSQKGEAVLGRRGSDWRQRGWHAMSLAAPLRQPDRVRAARRRRCGLGECRRALLLQKLGQHLLLLVAGMSSSSTSGAAHLGGLFGLICSSSASAVRSSSAEISTAALRREVGSMVHGSMSVDAGLRRFADPGPQDGGGGVGVFLDDLLQLGLAGRGRSIGTRCCSTFAGSGSSSSRLGSWTASRGWRAGVAAAAGAAGDRRASGPCCAA